MPCFCPNPEEDKKTDVADHLGELGYPVFVVPADKVVPGRDAPGGGSWKSGVGLFGMHSLGEGVVS